MWISAHREPLHCRSVFYSRCWILAWRASSWRARGKWRNCSQHLKAALAGQGALVVLEGEAGVGKTLLADHLLQNAAAQEATVISGTCQRLEQELPFAPLADALGRYLYGLPDAVVRSLPAASLARLIPIIPSLQDRLPTAYSFPIEIAISAEENRLRLIDALVTFLATLANLRPIALFLDDLQWADPDTLAVLGRLAQRVTELQFLLLLAYRPEELPENDALSVLLHTLNRTRAHYALPLARFTFDQVEAFVALHAGQTAPLSKDQQRLAAFLFETTHGNPLFVNEALRDLEERRSASGDTDAELGAWLSAAEQSQDKAWRCAATQGCRRSSWNASTGCPRMRTRFSTCALSLAVISAWNCWKRQQPMIRSTHWRNCSSAVF